MRKAIATIVAVLFVFVITSVSFAAEEKKAEPAKLAERPKVRTVTGEVKAVDPVAKTITIVKKVRGVVEETVITVDDKTKITRAIEEAFAGVKAGDKVTVRYVGVDGENVARSVAIRVAPPAKPAEKK